MHWCADCGTALAKHELEYKSVTDASVFLKFKVVGTPNEYLIIWTTTPWTIPFNLGVMVNPDLEYVKLKVFVGDSGNNYGKDHEKDNTGKGRKDTNKSSRNDNHPEKDNPSDIEQWIVSKGLMGVFMGSVAGKKYEIIEEFMGDKLKGVKYRHPLHDIVPEVYDELDKNHDKTFSVVLSEEYVDLGAGTGLVHMAPGCGPEDYEIGHKNGIPPFNNLNELGVFPDNMGPFAGWTAKKDDAKFIEKFKELGILIESTEVEHDYAHCWRCHNPVIFRTTEQWFFRVEDLKENMRELNKNIKWIPEHAGSKSFDSWLANLRDNGITRQRYWGTPLPVWKCRNENCKHYIVIGSIKELEEKAGKDNMPENLHKPWIDGVKFPCEKCSGEMTRESDILDVWIDAGVDSWACLDYPHRTDLFNEMFPADFILEGIDQIRGWFNMLFVASMVGMGKPSYKAVYMHGFINDAQGRKMSKSLGNYILPEEVIKMYGSETLRYYMIGGTAPGVDLNYNFEDMKLKYRNLSILWNLHRFMIDLKKNNDLKIKNVDLKKCGLAERYILSKMNTTLAEVSSSFENYLLSEIPGKIEDLYLELSRTYVQLVRDKASVGSDEEKQLVLSVMYRVMFETLKMFAPVCPILTEKIYLNLKEEFGLKEESIHLYSWSTPDASMLDKEVEESMGAAKDAIQGILSAREKAQIGVRWPLKAVTLVTKDKDYRAGIKATEDLIKTHTNVKVVEVRDSFDTIKVKLKPNYKTIGTKYAQDVPIIISHLVNSNDKAILTRIEEKGCYEFKIGKKEFKLVKEDFTVEKEVPKTLMQGESNKCDVYIDTTRTTDLDAEGYAREIMRRVQALRKKAGLQKNDDIKLCVNITTELLEMIEQFEDELKAKCGVKELHIGEEQVSFAHIDDAKIKAFKVWLSLEKM